MAITWPAKNNYATGDVLTAANMNGIGDDLNDLYAQTVSGGSALAAGKNILINGNFDIWQRGTSFANPTAPQYMADRWQAANSSNMTASQQTSGAPNGSRYYLRLTATGALAYLSPYQYIETAMVSPLWGKSATFSVKLRKNSTCNFTSITVSFQKSATVDATSAATWTDLATTSAALASIPTGTTSADWATFSCTATIPNDGTANSVRVRIEFNGATANGSILEISQAQLEAGSTVTPFARAGGTIQGELAACQRYYWRQTAIAGTAYTRFTGFSPADSTTQIGMVVQNPVPMRVQPTSIDYSNLTLYSGAFGTLSTIALASDNNNLISLLTVTGSGLTQYRPYALIANATANAYLGLSAEL